MGFQYAMISLLAFTFINNTLLASGNKAGEEKVNKKTALWKGSKNARFFALGFDIPKGVHYKVSFNDVVLTRENDGKATGGMTQIAQYFLLEKENMITVEIDKVLEADKDIKLKFYGKENEADYFLDKDIGLELVYSLNVIKAPFKVEYKLDLNEKAPVSKLLNKAEKVLGITSTDTKEIQNIVLDYIKAIRNSDAESFLKLTGNAYKDQASLSAGSFEKMEARLRKSITGMSEVFKDAKLDVSKIGFKPVFDGKVWYITDRITKGHFVQIGNIKWTLGFSKINGKWVISRTLGGQVL